MLLSHDSWKVAGGRVFKDRPAFVAKPNRVIFKDFVVGKVRDERHICSTGEIRLVS